MCSPIHLGDGDQLSASSDGIVLRSIANVTGDGERQSGAGKTGRKAGRIRQGRDPAIVSSRRGATGLENADRRAMDRRTAPP